MGNYVIGGILLLLVGIALVRAGKHFRGGGCCGSSNTVIRDKKSLSEPVISQKRMVIQGMHCKNCEIRVENGLNRLDGVCCRRIGKKSAIVELSKNVPDSELKEAVEQLGYRVVEIVDKL